MKNALRASRLRLSAGAGLLGLAALVLLFVLPNAAQQRNREWAASDNARKALTLQHGKLTLLEAEDHRLTQSRQRLKALLAAMPDQGAGTLQWQLSQRLYDLARKSGVRLEALKYGAPTREGTKGTELEVLDVAFTATGVYQNLKPFMLGLEDTRQSQLPFAVVDVKLEEGAAGARLSATLRSFRRAGRGQEAP